MVVILPRIGVSFNLIGMQEMLMQTHGGKMRLLRAESP